MSDEQKPDAPGKRGRKRDIPATSTWEDFYFIPSQGKYMYTPTRSLWAHESVVRVIKSDAAAKIAKERTCQALTWCPGLPLVIPNKVILEGVWRDKEGANTFNTYCPPDPLPGWADPGKAKPWLNLGNILFQHDAAHAVGWLAHRVQRPDIKINHGLVIGSLDQGIGKDTWLKGAQRGIGEWNWATVSATKAFNDATDKNLFLRSVICQISEAHDLGDKRFKFYDATKDWMASTSKPTIRVQDKWVLQHEIFNLVGPIITTNHKTDGLFIPPQDRRLYVRWSERKPTDFPLGYWGKWFDWFDNRGGAEHVAAYLATYDLSRFDPYAPPPKTEAWHAMVSANREPAENDLRAVLAQMGDEDFDIEPSGHLPEAITIESVRRWCAGVVNGDLPGDVEACSELSHDLGDRKQRRKTAHRLERADYSMASNPEATDGLYRVAGKRCAIYARRDVSGRARDQAIAELIEHEGARADRLAMAAPKPADPTQTPEIGA